MSGYYTRMHAEVKPLFHWTHTTPHHSSTLPTSFAFVRRQSVKGSRRFPLGGGYCEGVLYCNGKGRYFEVVWCGAVPCGVVLKLQSKRGLAARDASWACSEQRRGERVLSRHRYLLILSDCSIYTAAERTRNENYLLAKPFWKKYRIGP